MINVAAEPLAIQIHFLLLMMLPLGFERASQQVSSHAVRMSKQSQLATDQNQIHLSCLLADSYSGTPQQTSYRDSRSII